MEIWSNYQVEEVPGENLEHNGSVNLTDDELYYLSEQLSAGQFQEHPSFKGVKICKLETKDVPMAIQEKIRKLNGNITAFVAIKILQEVPLHQHTTDGEIYFGGSNGSVLLFDQSQNKIGEYNLAPESFTITTIGESHSVKAQNQKEATFFGVKFEV